MFEQLKSVGLTQAEIKVYLTLLDIGVSSAGIISRKSGVHRRSVYDILDRLIEKGLVSYIVENGKKRYQATNPVRLTGLLKQKEMDVKSVLPELKLKYVLAKTKQETLFFRGKKGIKNIFEDQLEEGKPTYILGASEKAPEIIKYYFHKFDKRRVKKKIKAYILFNSTAKGKLDKIPLAEIKYLPKQDNVRHYGEATTIIYGGKLAIIVWQENPVAILINQKDVSQSHKFYFDLIWRSI